MILHRLVPLALALALLAPLASPDAPAWTLDGAPAGVPVQGIGGSSSYLIASTFAHGAFESRDGGASWSRVPAFPPVTKARVAWDPTDANVGYVAGYGGVARTVDGGASWTLVLSVARAARIDVGPDARVLVGARYADASNHVLLSTDRGASWTDLGAPLPPNDPLCGVAFGRSNQEILTMTSRQSWYSRDGGATWTETPGAGFEFGIEDSGVVWRTDSGLLQRTLDGGASWADVPAPGFGTAIGPHPAGGVYVATGAGLAFTRDGGASWTNLGYPAAMLDPHAIFADPRDPDAVFYGDAIAGLSRFAPHPEGGFVLEGRARGLPPAAVDLVAGADALLVAAGPRGAYASRDGGQVWSHVGAGLGYRVTALAASADGARAYVAGVDALGFAVLEASADGARRFARVELPVAAGTPRALAADGATVLLSLATPDGGAVLVSRDGGASWESALPLAAADLAWDAERGEFLAATLAGVLAWREPGAWVPLGGPANATAVVAGDARFATGGGHAWRGELVLLPWAESGDALRAAAQGDALWLARADGSLARCEGAPFGACADASAPDAARDVALAAGRAFAATAAGLWRADA